MSEGGVFITSNLRPPQFDEKKKLLEQRWDHALHLVTDQMKKQRDEQVALAISKFDVEQRLKFQAEISKGLERVEGIDPFRSLWARLRYLKAERAPICGSISPPRTLFPQSRLVTLLSMTVTPNHSDTSSYLILNISSEPPRADHTASTVALSSLSVVFAVINGAPESSSVSRRDLMLRILPRVRPRAPAHGLTHLRILASAVENLMLRTLLRVRPRVETA